MAKILIVEDENAIANLIRLSLTKAGHLCVCAGDGAQAADLLEENRYDLVLLDIMLPEIDGMALMEYIRPMKTPVIFITAKGDVDDRVRGLRAGAEDYIVKPFEIVELLARDAQLRVYDRVFILLAALCALLSYALSYALTRPLTKLSEASRDIAAGQLSRRADIRTADEIGRVAQDFNAMADALEQNITELENSVERQKRFTGSFAHEVKTPMTSIIGYADLIRSEALDDEERRQAANFIVTEGKRLERLSQKLLQLQMLQSENAALSAAQPAALLEALAAEWGPVYEKQGVTLTWEAEDGACLIEPELVKTLLINLWDNARKAGAKRIVVRVCF